MKLPLLREIGGSVSARLFHRPIVVAKVMDGPEFSALGIKKKSITASLH